MNWARCLVVLLGWLIAAGCDQPAAAPPPSAPATPSAGAVDPTEPTRAQPKLQTVKLYLGPTELEAEVAVSDIQMRTGMMFRTNMAEMEAMIFVFPYASSRSFWMKNTLVPLSLAYINENGVIEEIHDLKPKDTNSTPSKSIQIQYVLEVNQGWFNRHGIGPGAVLKSDRGTMRDTFFVRR